MTTEERKAFDSYNLEKFKKQLSVQPKESFVSMTVEYFGLMSGDVITGYELSKRLEAFYSDVKSGKI